MGESSLKSKDFENRNIALTMYSSVVTANETLKIFFQYTQYVSTAQVEKHVTRFAEQQLFSDGFVVIEDFFTLDEVAEMKKAGDELTKQSISESTKTIFSMTENVQPQGKESYFMESGDKINYFYEAQAFGEDGKISIESSKALNKVGHALHWLHPTFKQATFHPKVKQLCTQIGLIEPRVCQINPHQDTTFLYTDPPDLYGFWFPLEDATLENGCLQFIPGSHRTEVHRRWVRNSDKSSQEFMIFDRPKRIYQDTSFVPVPVKKGACVFFHGGIVHKSDPNQSEISRHAYSFHLFDARTCIWSPENWLQTENGFPELYNN